jgi:NodT family efflux transporter outer membrane factor (OMF) lipoprotein
MRWFVALAAGLILAGCVSAPARQPLEADIDLPEEWTSPGASSSKDGSAHGAGTTENGGGSETGAGQEDGSAVAGRELLAENWWTTFGDPELDAIIEAALLRNYDLQAAAARLGQAEAMARMAGADLKPSIGLNLGASRAKQNFVGFPLPGGGVPSTTSTRSSASVDIYWEVDLWGRIRAGARAAVADLQATAAELRGARLSIAGRTAKTWFAVLEAREQLRLAEDTVESWRTSAEQVRARFLKGLRPAVELRLALSTLAEAEAVTELYRQQLDLYTRQLETLMGGYPGGDLLEIFAAGDLPPTPSPPPAGLPADLIGRRPDLVAAERRLAAADQRIREARRALYPRLALTASGGTVSEQFADLIDGDFGVWSLAAGLFQPIFEGGRLRANVDRSLSVSDEIVALYAEAALRAYAEVESTLTAEITLAGQEAALGESAENLVAARRLADDRYRIGVGDYLTVLESQSREFRALGALLTVKRQRLDNRIDLFLALGGGFPPEPLEAIEQFPSGAEQATEDEEAAETKKVATAAGGVS